MHVFITKPSIGVTLEFFCGRNTKHNTNTYFFTLYIAPECKCCRKVIQVCVVFMFPKTHTWRLLYYIQSNLY